MKAHDDTLSFSLDIVVIHLTPVTEHAYMSTYILWRKINHQLCFNFWHKALLRDILSVHVIFLYPRAHPMEVAPGAVEGGTWPQLAAQSRDDREIVLDLSAHPKHDEALCFLRGESHIDRMTLKKSKQQSLFPLFLPLSLSFTHTHTHTQTQTHTHTHTQRQTFIFPETVSPPPTVTRSIKCWLIGLPADSHPAGDGACPDK